MFLSTINTLDKLQHKQKTLVCLKPVRVMLVIDNREVKILKLFGQDTIYHVEALELGDVQIRTSEHIDVIIERKSLSDMVASLKDGRWKEQKLRLLQQREQYGTRLIYIIEGQFDFNEQGIIFGVSAKALVTMVLNLLFRERITVIQTQTMIDTIDFIKAFARRFQDPSYEWKENTTIVTVNEHQDAMIKSKKKDNVTNDFVFIMQLCSIPGISTKKARSIASNLGVSSMVALVDKLRMAKNALTMLMDVDGIGKTLGHDVLMYLGVDSNKLM